MKELVAQGRLQPSVHSQDSYALGVYPTLFPVAGSEAVPAAAARIHIRTQVRMYDEQRVSAGPETSPCFRSGQQPHQDGAYLSQMLGVTFTGATPRNSVELELAPGH